MSNKTVGKIIIANLRDKKPHFFKAAVSHIKFTIEKIYRNRNPASGLTLDKAMLQKRIKIESKRNVTDAVIVEYIDHIVDIFFENYLASKEITLFAVSIRSIDRQTLTSRKESS